MIAVVCVLYLLQMLTGTNQLVTYPNAHISLHRVFNAQALDPVQWFEVRAEILVASANIVQKLENK